ncbi:hypothetical protein OQE62_13490, partial [Microbulbifer halophilus]|uniref:hypothetical protein n=1 Tax=Microbulbifer halophilus TaxID=453963 RepID=UPI002244DBB3
FDMPHDAYLNAGLITGESCSAAATKRGIRARQRRAGILYFMVMAGNSAGNRSTSFGVRGASRSLN